MAKGEAGRGRRRARWRRRMVTCAVAAACAATIPFAALAATGTATISAGSFGFVSTPPNVSFSATLNGVDQTLSSNQALDVGDATGSGTGWNITATSTTFTTGGGTPHLLSTSATSITSAPSDTCDASATCTTGTNAITYPYVLPAASVAPTATKVFNAAANTGMGNQTVTAAWKLAVLASTYAGTYTSTWTISLVSGP
jgi:hypothetical protein